MKEKQLTISCKSVPSQKTRNYFCQSEYFSRPWIQLQGKWLEDLGFHIGDKIKVSYEENRIIIEPIIADTP